MALQTEVKGVKVYKFSMQSNLDYCQLKIHHYNNKIFHVILVEIHKAKL